MLHPKLKIDLMHILYHLTVQDNIRNNGGGCLYCSCTLGWDRTASISDYKIKFCGVC